MSDTSLFDALLASLSHDIKSPLTAIQLAAEICEMRAEDLSAEELTQQAHAIQRSVTRIHHLVDNVVQAVRLEQGVLALERRAVALADVARGVVDTLQPLATDGDVSLVVVADERASAALADGDPLHLFRVLTNLVSSGIRQSPPGGVVSLELYETETRVRCAVRDQGPGMPPEQRAHIFDRHLQGSGRRLVANLPLHVAQKIVHLHDGRIWVEDLPSGLGTSFIFELPRWNS